MDSILLIYAAVLIRGTTNRHYRNKIPHWIRNVLSLIMLYTLDL